MGGRLAEELFLDTMTTGAGNDIEQASELARKMVCEFGMSDLGPLTFGKKEEQIFLGREINQHRDYSEETAIRIDAEVKRFIDNGYKAAHDILCQQSRRADPHRQCAVGTRSPRRQRDQVDSWTARNFRRVRRRTMTATRAAGTEAGSEVHSLASFPENVRVLHKAKLTTISNAGPCGRHFLLSLKASGLSV